ncbi:MULTISPECIES: protoporphyrinogen oxidase HemJ [Halomonas]|jgi:putative membrane protein|uniref:Protoporphyrinogen IX oxidase n=3 Tax=Halomonas TaxID=2745 RepID=A0AAU7KJQ9_9GAMM|nr:MULTISPECIES: protoporphyrinogen oxidase HemJ [Halomonas]MBR9770167.1 protoporphyrinogen oxidase HemJ [Gammaproteobacteria bacterium]KJZ14854.1 membrane protein [Halomonas sp. S2151]MAR74022.1 TIGR00701 family protein [Halomonas sp.]MBR9879360.1 protoporphyrinogen oxidase HemJ [Gammaproteobacteria bacterium]MBS8269680.1 protoporphyrinogen oxidase HemJ [Halomonas litopenaei]|tara:strand:+ start:290 stop:721 length:432 start_codon:yes stop_codon:yes gene_type:complete
MYLWIKAFHLMSIVTWFAAMFYLPRLYVYHAMARDKGEYASMDTFMVMERKLYRGIMTPSMVAVLLLGALLVWLNPALMSQGWLHAKLALVVALVAYHHVCLIYLKQLAEDRCRRSATFFRVFNELPVLALVAIVILAVVKPF